MTFDYLFYMCFYTLPVISLCVTKTKRAGTSVSTRAFVSKDFAHQ